MPCTELWLAVSSCVESPRHQPLQLQHSATPSSSPAEVASPVCGPPGQPGHRQTSLEEQPGHHHMLRTLEVQAPSETGPSSEPGSHPFLGFLPDSLAAPAFLLPGSTLPYGCWISLYLLQSPLPLEWSCTLFCPVQSRIPSLGSQGLLPFLPTACLPQGLCVPRSTGETTHASGIVEGQAGLGELQGGQRDHGRLPGGAGLELALEEGQDLDRQRGGEGISCEVTARAKVWCQEGPPLVQNPEPLFPEHTVGTSPHGVTGRRRTSCLVSSTLNSRRGDRYVGK